MDNFNNQNYNQNYNPNQNYQNADGRLNYPQPQYNSNFNTSGARPISGWSWGASMFGWVWGIGNHTYMPFLSFIPILNLFWWIVCGIKGHEWALNSGHFKTVEEFNAVQRSWNRAGKIVCIVTLIFLVFYILLMVLVFGTTLAAIMSEI